MRIDPDTGQVIDSDMNPIPGLYAAGELVGGIFYFNYPGGSGLMSGTVFGRIAGTGAPAMRTHGVIPGAGEAASRNPALGVLVWISCSARAPPRNDA